MINNKKQITKKQIMKIITITIIIIIRINHLISYKIVFNVNYFILGKIINYLRSVDLYL